MTRRLRRYAVTTMIAIIPTAIVATMMTNLLTPTEKPTASFNIVETASIVNSPTTIGIADSDLVALSGADFTLDDAEKAQVDATLDAMQALGVNTVRMGIPWAFIEPVPPGTPFSPCPCWGTTDYIVQQANERGMAVLGDITATPALWGQDPGTPGGLPYSAAPDPAAYSAFVSSVAQRYAGQVSAYEIWNEPNSLFGWTPQPDAAAYTELLKAAYPAIKAADPNATVVAGVLVTGVFTSPLTVNPVDYVSTMYANGAKGFFDALSVHPYQYQVQFSEGAGVPYSPLTQLIDIRQLMIDNGDSALRIWATEYGLPTAGPNGVSEETQAAFIKDFLETWATIGYAGPAFIYTTRDQPGAETTDQGSFGVYTSDWQQKLAAKVILALTGGPTGQPPTNPGDALGAALNALLQQLAAAVGQAFAAAAQQVVQAAVTALATAIVQAITDALGGIFSAQAVPLAQQESIIEGVNAAKMSIPSLTVEPDASEVTSLAEVEGSATLGAKGAEGLDATVAPDTESETATEEEEAGDVTDTESDATETESDGTNTESDATETESDGTNTESDGTDETVDTDKTDTEKTDTEKTDTEKTDKTDGDKTGTDKTGTDKNGTDKNGTDKNGTDKNGTDKNGTDKTTDKTGADKTGTEKNGTDKTTDKTTDTDKTPKSDPPVRKTDPPRPNAETTSFSSPEAKKAPRSEAGTVWATGAIAG